MRLTFFYFKGKQHSRAFKRENETKKKQQKTHAANVAHRLAVFRRLTLIIGGERALNHHHHVLDYQQPLFSHAREGAQKTIFKKTTSCSTTVS